MAALTARAASMTKHRPIWAHRQTAHDSQSLRTYRARSWIRAAKLCQSLDGRFICFWLGFNALYGQREATDRADMEWFLKQMVDLRDQAIRSRLLSLKREATALLGLEFLYRSYWSDGFTDALGEEMMRRLVNLEVAWRSGTPEECLHDVFDCLHELRNQILHGPRHSAPAGIETRWRRRSLFCPRCSRRSAGQ